MPRVGSVSELRWSERREAGKPRLNKWEGIENRIHTETPGLDISFFSSSRVRVGISKVCVLADGEMLVEAPLPRTCETWLGGRVRQIQRKDRIVRKANA